MIFASIPFPCATDSISQYHKVRKKWSFAATVSTNLLGFSLLFRSHPFISPTDPTSWRKDSCPDLDYGTSVHFTSPSGCQRLAQASAPNSIPPEASYGGKSIFSPTNYLHSEGFLLYIRYPHTRPLYVEAFVDHYQIKRILIKTGAGFHICTLSTARQWNLDPSWFAPHYSCLCIWRDHSNRARYSSSTESPSGIPCSVNSIPCSGYTINI